MPYANNKGADQPAHLDSIIPLLTIAEIQTLAGWAGLFESYLIENPEDRFSRDEAQIETSRKGTKDNKDGKPDERPFSGKVATQLTANQTMTRKSGQNKQTWPWTTKEAPPWNGGW